MPEESLLPSSILQRLTVAGCLFALTFLLGLSVLAASAESLPGPAESQLRALLPERMSDDFIRLYGEDHVHVEGFTLATELNGKPLYAAFTVGTLPLYSHHLALFVKEDSSWRELARQTMEPEWFEPGPYREVAIEPDAVWLEMTARSGNRGRHYQLLRFDGESLRVKVNSWKGRTEDFDGDGVPEVVVDESSVIFHSSDPNRCFRFRLLRWDGEDMSDVLTVLPKEAAVPRQVCALANRAIVLAHAELWRDALSTIEEALETGGRKYDAVQWIARAIRLNAEPKRDSQYPHHLLAKVFYGDYEAALEPFRGRDIAAIFDPAGELVTENSWKKYEKNLFRLVRSHADRALGLKPDLAEALFLRAWATHLSEPDNPDATTDLQRAAKIDPNERLYADSLEYIRTLIR